VLATCIEHISTEQGVHARTHRRSTEPIKEPHKMHFQLQSRDHSQNYHSNHSHQNRETPNQFLHKIEDSNNITPNHNQHSDDKYRGETGVKYPVRKYSSQHVGAAASLNLRSQVISRSAISKSRYSTSIHSESSLPADSSKRRNSSGIPPEIQEEIFDGEIPDSPNKNHVTVFEYSYMNQSFLWDYTTGWVYITSIWKAVGNAKADVNKLISTSPEIRNKVYKTKGGCLRVQGTWIQYDVAKTLASRFCYPIRFALVPIFGNDFVDLCLKPGDPGYGLFLLTFTEKDLNKRRRRRRKGSVLNKSFGGRAANPNFQEFANTEFPSVSVNPKVEVDSVHFDRPEIFKSERMKENIPKKGNSNSNSNSNTTFQIRRSSTKIEDNNRFVRIAPSKRRGASLTDIDFSEKSGTKRRPVSFHSFTRRADLARIESKRLTHVTPVSPIDIGTKCFKGSEASSVSNNEDSLASTIVSSCPSTSSSDVTLRFSNYKIHDLDRYRLGSSDECDLFHPRRLGSFPCNYLDTSDPRIDSAITAPRFSMSWQRATGIGNCGLLPVPHTLPIELPPPIALPVLAIRARPRLASLVEVACVELAQWQWP
jgi:hypothetical protein